MTALATLLMPLAAASAAAPAADTCDRACMRTQLDTYLAALVAHDPAKAPLATTLVTTENGHAIRPGEGLWKSASGFGPMQRSYFDTQSGQAAFYGSVYEGGAEAMLSVRVKFAGKKIVEAETIVARKGEPLHGPDLSRIDQPWAEGTLAKADRSQPAKMTAAVNRYFDAIAGADAKLVPAVKGCDRIENGTRTTHRHRTGGGLEDISGDCTAGFNSFPIKAVAYRRMPVIDTEAGVVLGIGLFQRPPNATWADGSPRKRNLIHEYFSFKQNRIDRIFAVMRYIEPSEPDSTGW